MNTIRKLESEDVRAIFESLHDKKPPPPGLKFQIVPVGPEGLRLSPPTYTFDDGIYVLLRPDKKKNRKKNEGSPAIPPHLAHLKMENPPLEKCQWSLSGPQFPRPTAIQQRYCYPKGNPAYASKKGGALWTMYNRDGEEDDEFRLLHVYFSVKRAANNNISRVSNSISSKTSKVKRKPKRKAATTDDGLNFSPRKDSKKQKRSKSKTEPKSKLKYLPVTKGSLPPFSPRKIKNLVNQQPFANVSPNTVSTSSVGIQRNESDDGFCFGGHLFHPIPSFMADEIGTLESGTLTSSFEPNRYRSTGNIFRRGHSITFPHPGSQAANTDHHSPDQNPTLDLDMLTGLRFSDPSFMIGNPDTEMLALPNVHQRTIPRHQPNESFSETLVKNLNVLHEKIINGWILSRPHSERGHLVSIVADWARCVSRSPFELTSGERVNEQRDDAADDNIRVTALMMEGVDKAVAV